MDKWKTWRIKKKKTAGIMGLFIATTACIPWFGDALPVPIGITRAGNMCKQHALTIPAG